MNPDARLGRSALTDQVAMASPSPRRRGTFIVLVGPDGVGKTTVARAIIERYEGPTSYFHFLPGLLRRLDERPPGTITGPPPKSEPAGSRLLGWMRLLRNVARSWIAYLVRIHPALRRGCLVVGDRWLYGYLVQPLALKYYGPRGLVTRMLRILPRPDLVVNLRASAGVIRERKQELTMQNIEAELDLWARLPFCSVRTFDAGAAPGAIAAQVLDTLRTPDTLPAGRSSPSRA